MRPKMTVAAVLAAFSLTLTGLGPIEREGDGERRSTLNTMEAKAFPAAALKAMGVEPGGVTVFVTLSQVSPESLLEMRKFGRLEERFADKGLKVIGVVDEASWETLSVRKQAGLIKSDIVLDEGGAFRAAVMSDENPDVYIMDRAGQLRYADISADSAASVLPELLGETAEEAAGEMARREAAIASGEDPFGGPVEIKLSDIPATAYATANWPRHNTGGLNALNKQGEKLPVALGKETWISKKDRDTEGHVLVLDFWATWCGPCIRAQPKLESLQKKHNDDLMVMAIAGSGEDMATVKRYLAQHKKSYYNLFDGKQTVSNSLRVQAIPHTVVMSTDGVVRWQGNPLSSNFEQVVEQVIAADPYLKAKREGGVSGSTQGAAESSAAEEAYASQKWPVQNKGELYASNVQGQTLENPLAGLEWLDGEAADTENKVTIVDFWATWCGPCIAFSPKLDTVAKRFKDEVVAVGVSGQNDPKAKVMKHLEEHPVSYRHAYAEGQELYKKVGVSGIPHVLVISSDGVVRWQGFPNAIPDFEGLVARIVMADRKARRALED